MYFQEREKTQDGESVREGVQPLQQQKSENPKGYILMEKGFLGGSVIRICLPMQETKETWVWSLGWEDPLEKGMATHSSILAWEIPWTEELGGL